MSASWCQVMKSSPDLLQWMRYVMIFSGQWVQKQSKSPFTQLYKVNILWIYLYIVEVHCTFIPTAVIWWQCKSNVNEMINCYLRVVGCLSITIILKSDGREDIIKLIRSYELNDFNKETDKVKGIYTRYSKLMNLILKISITGGIIAVINWYILGVIIEVERTEQCPMIKGLLFQLWYPFDIRKHMWVARIVDASIVISVGVFLTYSKLLPMCMLIFVLAQLKILQRYIKDLDNHAEKLQYSTGVSIDDARFLILKKLIRRHQQIIGLMEKVQAVTGIVVMIFYFTEPVALASYLVLILLADSKMLRVKVALPFVVTIIQLYVFSRLATEIIAQSLNVSDVLYNQTQWRKYNIRERKLLTFMMLRAQRRLSVKAALIGDTSLGTFTKIIKTCYTIQTGFATFK